MSDSRKQLRVGENSFNVNDMVKVTLTDNKSYSGKLAIDRVTARGLLEWGIVNKYDSFDVTFLPDSIVSIIKLTNGGRKSRKNRRSRRKRTRSR